MLVEDRFYTTRDELRLHYKVYGADAPGPAIFCLPGLTRNERDFEAVAPFLADLTINGAAPRVYCPSFRGRAQSAYDPVYSNYHPRTYAEDVRELMAHEAIEEAGFVGTSLGAIVTLILAGTMADKMIAAVLNDLGPDLGPEGLARIAGYIGTRHSWPTWELAAEAHKGVHGIAFPDANNAFWLEFARRTCREQDGAIHPDYDQNIATAIAEGPPPLELWPLFEALACPTLSVRGEISDILLKETQDKMVEINPDMHRVTVPRIGHAPTMEETPARKAIADLLTS